MMKGFAFFGIGTFMLAASYQIFRVADTWDKRNTDQLVQWLGISLFFLVAILAIILAIVFSIRVAIKNRQMQPEYDDYYPAPRQGRQQQYDQYASVPQQRALPGPAAGTPIPWGGAPQGYGQGYGAPYGGQGQYGSPYGQGNTYGFAPVPPLEGQMQNQGAQYDLNGVDW